MKRFISLLLISLITFSSVSFFTNADSEDKELNSIFALFNVDDDNTTNANNTGNENTTNTSNDSITNVLTGSYNYIVEDGNINKIKVKDSDLAVKNCEYKNWTEKVTIKNREVKVIVSKTNNNREVYKKVVCDNWVAKVIFTWKKAILPKCYLSNSKWDRVEIESGKTKVVKFGQINKEYKCNLGKLEKLREWIDTENGKKNLNCDFKYKNNEYKLLNNTFVIIKEQKDDYNEYSKYVCENWNVEKAAIWRNKIYKFCKFYYKDKLYVIKNRAHKVFFKTNVWEDWTVTKSIDRLYHCVNWVAKIYKGDSSSK